MKPNALTFKKLLAACLVFSFSVNSFAQIGYNPNLVPDYSNDRIFKKTIRECSYLGPIQMEWESLKSSWNVFDIGALWNIDAAVNMYKNGGLSPDFHEQINSDAFYAAVNQCFPNSEFLRNSFVLALIVNDIKGSIGGGFAAFYLSPTKFLKALKVANPRAARVITAGLITLASVRVTQAWKEFFAENKKRGNEQVEELTAPPKDDVQEVNQVGLAILNERIRSLNHQLQNPNLSDARRAQIKKDIETLEQEKASVLASPPVVLD